MDHDARQSKSPLNRAKKQQRANDERMDVGSDVTIDDVSSDATKLVDAAHDGEEEDAHNRSQCGRSSARSSSSSGHRSGERRKERHGKSRKERHEKSHKERHGNSRKSPRAAKGGSSAHVGRPSKTKLSELQFGIELGAKANDGEGSTYSSTRGVDGERRQHGRSTSVTSSARVHSAQHKPRRGDRDGFDQDQETNRKRRKVQQPSPAFSRGSAAAPASYDALAVEARTSYVSQRSGQAHNVAHGPADVAVAEEQAPASGVPRVAPNVETPTVPIGRDTSNNRASHRVNNSDKIQHLDMSTNHHHIHHHIHHHYNSYDRRGSHNIKFKYSKNIDFSTTFSQ